MNMNDTFELMTKSTNQGLANLRKVAEINLSTWDRLVATQMAVMNQCFETASKQTELLKSAKRADELFGLQTELEKVRGEQKLAEIGAQREAAIDTGAMAAFTAAIKQQGDLVKAAGKGWVADLSASVRPVVTYALISVYLGLQIAMGVTALQSGGVQEAFKAVMTPDFMALVAGIMNYYFMNRTLERRGLL